MYEVLIFMFITTKFLTTGAVKTVKCTKLRNDFCRCEAKDRVLFPGQTKSNYCTVIRKATEG